MDSLNVFTISDIVERDIPLLVLVFQYLEDFCIEKGLTSISLPERNFYKNGFIFLKDNSFQAVINPEIKKVLKNISILEDGNTNSFIEYGKEILVEYQVVQSNKLVKVEKTLKDNDAILFQKEFKKLTQKGQK